MFVSIKKMLKPSVLIASVFVAGSLSISAFATEFDDFKNEGNIYQAETEAEFAQYKKELEDGFAAYKNAYEEEFAAYKKEIGDQWGEFVDSDKKRWVSYASANNVRRTIDFEAGEVSIDVLDGDKMTTQELDSLLKAQVDDLLNVSEKNAFKNDRVASKVEQRLTAATKLAKTGKLSDERLFNFDVPAIKMLHGAGFIKAVNSNTVAVNKRKAPGQDKNIVSIRFQIPDAKKKRAQRFVEAVIFSAQKEDVPIPLVFAIMETESSFNPMARSHVPAFGLMQVVPRSAGRDASKYLFGKSKILSPSFLYKSENNITVGSAYLHILYYKYLKRIKNPVNRLYCVIAAYNTGTGNVARAVIGSKNVTRASKRINQMQPKELYKLLITKLPHEETRRYLKKVSFKMAEYQQKGV